MVQKLAFGLLLILGALPLSHQERKKLHIGTLIPGLGNEDFFGFKRAIEFAAETIYDQGLLPGYELVFNHKETLRMPAKAIQSLIEFKSENSSSAVKICILGPSTSKIARYTAQLASIWGTLQVSYGASSPELTSGVFPKFLSVLPTSNSLNKAMIELTKFFSWRRVALAYDMEEKSLFLPAMNALRDRLKADKVEILTEEGISSNERDRKFFVQTLKEKDARVVVALMRSDTLLTVMCEAFKQGFYGDKIVWVAYYTQLSLNQGRNIACNETDLLTVLEGTFALNVQYLRTDKNKTISGLTGTDYKMKMLQKGIFPFLIPRTSIAFDTTWLLALSLNDSFDDAIKMQSSISDTQYFLLGHKLKLRMMSREFEGISGKVVFNSTERLGTVVIQQKREGRLVDIAQHHSSLNLLTFFPNQSKPEVLFKGTKYIQDGPRHINELRHYSLTLLIAIWVVCAFAITIALALFYFNIKNREIRYIKMSSPHVNNIIIFGGFLCYTKVVFDTLDSRFVSLETYGHFCNARVWMMSLGFTTAFGAMFSKTWRVHRIFTASKNFRRAVIKNFHLYGLLFGLLAVDCLLLTVWMVISPFRSGTLSLPSEDDNEADEIIHPYIFNCTSKHEKYFLITTLGYKGLLLVFGIFLAWETRNIEIKALNDSKYIGISVYNVVILSVIGVILATTMAGSDRYNVYLALMSLVVVLCTAATLGIVFVPKIIGLQRIINSTTNEKLETVYSVKSSDDGQTPCCCCEECKCKCSGRGRKASIHVSNKFLAGASGNRRKSRAPSVPSVSVTKPKVSVHINARVSLSTYPISESPMTSPEDSSRLAFLSNNEA
ncbi:gamma-aminobutyric acid type B receptor subunit 2-like [Dendronephthya gigantea]|uniref:gamma-aminobutyric acid type B receptor subunit 2-like n=1 Tax=Dendronephthya gigantea TaxID=151771 RepID=UPI00106B8CEC|nr:gamma-aminobutyric acid type B receptor subunit 2-like [Dendronephthya gigantea]XP_028399794.1 gamma-aminobutyric acid type B receptor subunit 2-like [Dendronephthya gigantea]XP_028399795.1 gamma-aminobutyric acid type B receptor subunit 2-like [Dendronephthya gigantea]